jgi:hypothetical protein
MIDLRKHGTGIINEGAAGIGQFDAARLPAEQLGIDFAFDCADLTTEWWRLHPEAFSSPCDIPFLSDGYHVPKLPEFHALPEK